MTTEIRSIVSGGNGGWVEFDYGDDVINGYSVASFEFMTQLEAQEFAKHAPESFRLMQQKAIEIARGEE